MGAQVVGTLINLLAGDETQRVVCCVDKPCEQIEFGWEPPEELKEIGIIDSWIDRRSAQGLFLSSLQRMRECVDTFAVPAGSNPPGSLLDKVVLGSLQDPRRIVSASSPQQPGLIVFAADWSHTCTRRAAANLLHELVHQVLYWREAAFADVVRANSLGYSPWKLAERPGRWIWHSFWTFAVHCAYLAETAKTEQSVSAEDRLEVALMYLRLKRCLDSVESFEIVVDPAEMSRMRGALSAVAVAVESPEGSRLFCDFAAAYAPRVDGEFESWKDRLLSLHGTQRY
jgi:hypothetical protein